jgi:hypothetical protein
VDERATPRRPPLPTATNMNATLQPQRDSRRTTFRTLSNEPWLDVGMAHRQANGVIKVLQVCASFFFSHPGATLSLRSVEG